MSFKNNQNDTALPTSTNQLKSTVALLPRFFRTEANKKFLQSTIDQLIQPGVAEKVNGYVGRTTAKAYKNGDNYLNEVSVDRQNYQFEPAAVIKDSLDNVTFYKDYNDYINQLSTFGADVSDHSKINSQDMYAWNPHIDWDKFVNFREYYWMPNGPQSVPISAKSKEVVKTYKVGLTTTDNNVSYLFTPDGKTANPTLNFYRGEKYRFNINTPGHPIAFAISRTFTPGTAVLVAGREGIRSSGLFDSSLYGDEYDTGGWIVLPDGGSVSFNEDTNVSTLYPDGIVKLGTTGEEISVVYVENGIIEFTVPDNAPSTLFYISKNDINTSGIVNVYNIEESTQLLDVEKEIVGMQTYKSGNGVELSNGMKIFFRGSVTPSSYLDGYWYVEGVGTQIALIKESNLTIPAAYSSELQVQFDSQPFDTIPFSDASGYATEKDYLVINRSSVDRNPWSRYNKWIHRDVIEYSAKVNNQIASIDQESRAKRPIIEFEAGIKLFNYGTYAKNDVDLVDTFTKDIFSTIEGSIGYNIDGIDLVNGMRILFTADTDSLVNNNIYQVKFINFNGQSQISLIETDDTMPLELETVFVKSGVTCAGKTFYYEAGAWNLAQQKTSRNQAPLFALCCPVGNDYANLNIFDSTTFKGTKIFSYAIGDGTVDLELGFPLTYRTIENFGDIVFDFNLLNDKFTFQNADLIVEVGTDTANLKKYTDRDTYTWVNAWSSVSVKSKQRVLKQYVATLDQLNSFEIDTYDNAGLLTDLQTIVYVNNQLKKNKVEYNIAVNNKKAYVEFAKDLSENDLILIKTLSSATKNKNGRYEFPINLEKNPLNDDIGQFTLGEVTDHVDSMLEEIYQFDGVFPGASNLRDLGNVSQFGKRFVKHSGPVNLPLYHITNKNYNIVNALRFSKREYSRFKRVFVETASTLGYDGPIKLHVDKVLASVNNDKVNTQPFYFSDMLGYGSATRLEFIVLDNNPQYYPLKSPFNLNSLSTRQVSVYLNGKQLVHGKQYEFTSEGFVLVYSGQVEDDIIEIFDYSSTDGSFIPPTPTKLGLYPAYEPGITIDDTYLTQEPSKNTMYKLYGQLDNTPNYTPRGWFYPVYDNKSAAVAADKAAGGTGTATVCRFAGLNRLVYMPTVGANLGVEDNANYNEYPYGVAMIRGHDGSFIKAYKDYRDDLLIELETRIFNNIKIQYNTDILDVNDFAGGFFRKTDYSKAQIDNVLLNDFIQWLKIVNNDYTLNDFYDRENQFTYNYSSMTSPSGESLPGFWRGIYMQAFDTDRPHSHPWEMLGFSIRPDWWIDVYGPAPYTSNNLVLWKDLEQGIIRAPNRIVQIVGKYARPGLSNFIPVDERGKLRSPLESNFAQNFFFRYTTQGFKFGDHAPVETAWRKSSEYPFSLITARVLNNPAKMMGLGFDISRIEKNLAGQYIYTDTGKMLQLDKISFPNSYADNATVMTSGLVNYIHNLVASNVLKVYNDYKNDVATLTNQMGFKLAGFSEKEKLKLVLDSRSPAQSSEGGVFVPFENYSVFLNTSSPNDIAVYSGVVIEKAASGYIINGYSQEIPYFSYYSYVSSASDVTVTVGGISEITTTWTANKPYAKGQIIEYKEQFYRATENFTSGTVFSNTYLAPLDELPIVGGKRAVIRKNFDKRQILKLPYGTKLLTSQEVVDFILGYSAALEDRGFAFENFNTQIGVLENWRHSVDEFLFWTTQGWAEGTTIQLSPASKNLSFFRNYAVVDNLYDEFYDYSIFKADGTALDASLITISRGINDFGIITKTDDEGIYHARLPLVQKEHVVLLDNKTVFNDIVYQPTTGYRQDRIKVMGYRSDNWQGSLNIPGFMFDTAEVTEWSTWKDYKVGQLVKHKQFYYVAKTNIVGQEIFADANWVRLNEKPTPKLLTNFDYRTNQFTDFYEVESDYFDEEQQRLAQHIIGYQKRTYLQNIINDDVSQFKFYQGFIRDKGTKNAISKLFDSLTAEDHEGLEFYEEWAVQLGRYGSLDNYTQLELVVNESQIKESPQSFELVNQAPTEVFDKAYRYVPSEVYNKPENYNSEPFPTKNPQEYILTAGYVNEKDINYVAQSVDELLESDANSIKVNEYIWLTDDSQDGWNVYQHTDSVGVVNSLVDISELSSTGRKQKQLILNDWVDSNLTEGEYVSVRGAQFYNLNGFYRVESTTGNKIIVSVGDTNAITVFTDQTFILTRLRSVRIKDLNRLELKPTSWYPRLPVYTQDTVNFVVLENNVLVVDTRDTSINVTLDNNNFVIELRNTSEVYIKLYVGSREMDNLNNLNALIQQKKYKGQKVWVDNYNGQWAVVENNEVYSNQQTIENPSSVVADDQKFGSSISVTKDNTTMVVGDPTYVNINDYGDTTDSEYGKVYFYKRNRNISNFVLEQDITLVGRSTASMFDNTGSNFGASVSVAEDGNYLAVGIPNASNIKTTFKGKFDPLTSYNAYDVVTYKEKLWRTTRDIDASFAPIIFNTHSTYDLLNTAKKITPLLVTGNPGMSSTNLSHILVRAPTNMYNGSNVNDKIFLQWNSRSFSNPTLDYAPWNNAIPQLTANLISATDGHVISQKVEKILMVNFYKSLPSVGDTVLTDSGSAVVAYVDAEINNAIIYINSINGIIDSVSTLTTDIGLPIGNYIEQQTNANPTFGGFWMIDIGAENMYATDSIYEEAGTGLVYVDFKLVEETRTTNLYKNIQTDVARIGNYVNNNSRASYITQLSYNGTPAGVPGNVPSDLWIIQSPVSLSATVGSSYDFRIYTKNRNINLATKGLPSTATTETQTVHDIWDGYVDFEYVASGIDSQGNAYEPVIGDVIDIFKTVGAKEVTIFSATVKFYKRQTNSVRVYVDIISGAWIPTTVDCKVRKTGTISRTIGRIVSPLNDIVLSNTSIGKLLVFKHNKMLPVVDAPEIINEEYWFYTSSTVTKSGRVSDVPSTSNKNYTRTYNISANATGSSSGISNQGAVAIYKKLSTGKYELDNILVSEHADHLEFGTKVRISKVNNTYTLFVSSKGTPGFIETFIHGPSDNEIYRGAWLSTAAYYKGEVVWYDGLYYKALRDITTQNVLSITTAALWENISWKANKDESYVGDWSDTESYDTGNVVLYNNNEYYAAATNIPAGTPFNASDWIIKADTIEFAGYMPGPTQAGTYTTFGPEFDVSRYGDSLIAACSDTSAIGKSVAIYHRPNNFRFLQKFGSYYDNEGFAEAISISPNGTTIAVAEPFNDDIKINQGKVYIYLFDSYSERYVFNQTLLPPKNEATENFGSAISLSNNNIVISSLNGDMVTPTTFDSYLEKDLKSTSVYVNNDTSSKTITPTTFDNGFTDFSNRQIDTGVVYIFENISDSMVYAEQLYNLSSTSMFGETLVTNGNHIYAGTVHAYTGSKKGKILDYRKPVDATAWNIIQTAINPVDSSKIHEVFMYNKRLNQVVSYLDFIDPVQGKIAGPAEQEIKYKVAYDPAIYTFGSDGFATTSTVDWGVDQVGEVWWKLDGVKFANAYQGSLQYQKLEWNKILSGNISVREWVESTLLPADWDKIADTEKGLARGISGKSVYGNTNYCQRYGYDDVSKTFAPKYYFWVEGKVITPTVKNRKLSISDVQKLIENPRLQGYRFVNFLSSNRFVLNNCESLISNDDIVLCIRYNTTNKLAQNIHNEYQIISDGLSTSVPHNDIETKWFDSLIGFDQNNRPVPDASLSAREKYGVQSEPRQSMFVNRNEALKQTIERVNAVLNKNLIVDTRDISSLLQSQKLPSIKLNQYDAKVGTLEELVYVSTNKVKQAKLTPIIVNGKLIRVDIVDGGRGYKDLNFDATLSTIRKGPSIDIIGTGLDAEVETEIDSIGRITKVNIISTGSGYNSNTIVVIRRFSVLVETDSSSFGKWAMYTWDDVLKQWFRTSVQEYDVSKFWNYVDWYADGYNAFTSPKRILAGTYQLDEVEDLVGDVIKIDNIGTGGWVLLEKIASETTVDYTINYKTVGRHNGTIQFTDMLYDYSKNTIGFDNRSFDSYLFDNVPSTELRIILNTIKNDIFISNLQVEYNQLFIAGLRYVLSEQPYVDWMFKTSFVRINHKIGELRKDITFNADNLSNYQDYVNEVKPYSTTVREFVSSYTALDTTNSSISDFDLAPVYDASSKSITPASITVDQDQLTNLPSDINTYPRKNWLDGHTYSLVEVKVSDGGAGYNAKPTISFEGGGGTGATALAYVGYGKITKIVVTNPGSGYTSAPTVIISDSPTAIPARASAIIGNGLTRTPKITMKYDRISRGEYYLTRNRIETFVGTNVNTVFDLNWPMNTERKNVAVYVDNQKLLKSEFTYTNIEHKDKTYTRQRGRIVFTKPPTKEAEIRVEYIISINLLSAIDRIRFEYKPTAGMPAVAIYDTNTRDYSQLMTGIDYGGVEIQGLNFNETSGWSQLWSSAWDVPDGTLTGSSVNYDMAISGGNIAYTTATGIASTDTIIDGDGFLTPLTSGGPEELIPGQMFDTVSITVYTRSTDNTSEVPIFAFSQFKDMINRTHYKRVNTSTPILTKDLNYYDLQISLDDASSLPNPNPASNLPGIIFINGERIEYFVKDGNLLKQLRRGTLGTGIKELHATGSAIIVQDSTKNLPYTDITQKQTIVADGKTNNFVLEFNKIQNNGTYISKDEFEVFVGGNRLKKDPSIAYSIDSGAMDSPEGDITLAAEFIIDNATGSITLTQTPTLNQRITIIRKIGSWWSDIGATLESSSSDVALFLKSTIS